MSATVNAPPSTAPAVAADLLTQERHLRRTLGFWSLAATSFGGIIGSGWLYGALYGARIAGPAALVSWLIGGMAVSLVALVLIELGASRPEAGGTVRWPLYANGRLVGTLVGWSVLLATASSTEVLAITGYAGHYLPWLYSGQTLSLRGVFVAAGLEAVLTVLNWYGVRLFAQLNLMVTGLKFIVPGITIVALLASGFHGHNLTGAGGFAPYGWGAVLSAVSTGGIIYSVNGFQGPVDLSGEARDARRDVPRAVLVAIAGSVLLYLLLQFAFIVALPPGRLGHGWGGIDFTSPFGQLAILLNLGWLSSLLYADAVFSPGGSEFVGVATGGRVTYALAKNRLLPRYFLTVDGGSGVPRRALVLNYLLGLVVLIPLRSWQDLVSVVGDVFLFGYAVSAIAAGTFGSAAPTRLSGWIPGIRWIAPVSFVVSSEIIYWSTWHDLRLALPLTLAGVPIHLIVRRSTGDRRPLAEDAWFGGWLVAYLGLLLVFSTLGTFGGSRVITAPYDSIAVGAFASAIYQWAVRSGARHIERTATLDVDDSAAVSDAFRTFA